MSKEAAMLATCPKNVLNWYTVIFSRSVATASTAQCAVVLHYVQFTLNLTILGLGIPCSHVN